MRHSGLQVTNRTMKETEMRGEIRREDSETGKALVIGPIDEEALRAAIELMDEYPEVFEELAK